MRVLDLFAGLKGWSEPWEGRGHDIITLDNDPKFNCDITVNILEFDYKMLPKIDVILASPPCEKFSTMGFQYGWFDQFWRDGKWATVPMTPEAELALELVERTVQIIKYFGPRWWVIENPKALLRKTDVIPEAWGPNEIWYCHYGEHRAKPTDLWGHFPKNFELKPPCHNRRESHTDPACCCKDHTAAPRGSRTGTQGMSRELSAKIPFPLADSVMRACEREYES